MFIGSTNTSDFAGKFCKHYFKGLLNFPAKKFSSGDTWKTLLYVASGSYPSPQFSGNFFLSEDNNSETIADIEANDDTYCLRNPIEKFPL